MASIQRVDAPADPRLADYRSARDPAWRRRTGLFLAESALVVRRLLAESRFRTRSILATEPIVAGLQDVLERAPADLVVHVAGHAVQREVMGFNFHRGCLALAERGPDLDAAALLAPDRPLLLVLEDVADPDNVGALFRNGRAFGVAGVLLSPGTGDPLYPKAIRVSVGATLSVPHARLPQWPADLDRLRSAGYAVVALTPGAGAAVEALGTAGERLALLVGSEGRGLSDGALALADRAVRIPMAPGVDSLNVAVAAGIALYHVRRVAIS